MRVLITGMSGTGKSSVVRELRRQGYTAYDADDDGFTEPSVGGAWRWRVDAVATVLNVSDGEALFFAGCSEEQAAFSWGRRVLLTAPEPVILADLHDVEPLLRRSADAVIDSTLPLSVVVDEVLTAGLTSQR